MASATARKLRPIFNRPSCNILIACMPKSGSTYLARLLSQATGFDDLLINDMIAGGQQELSKRRLQRSVGLKPGSVSQVHLRCNSHNRELIQRFGFKPVVLTRNLFDLVPSNADHFRREGTEGVLNYVPNDWQEMDDKALHDFVIHNCLPWYLGFLYAWHDVAGELDVCWLSYEQLFEDQAQALERVMSFCGLSCSQSQIEDAIALMDGRDTRLNKGVCGRGEAMLLPEQKQAIREIARSWQGDPAVLKRVGIE